MANERRGHARKLSPARSHVFRPLFVDRINICPICSSHHLSKTAQNTASDWLICPLGIYDKKNRQKRPWRVGRTRLCSCLRAVGTVMNGLKKTVHESAVESYSIMGFPVFSAGFGLNQKVL